MPLSPILGKLSLVEGAIEKDKYSIAAGFTVVKIANVDSSITLIHLSQSVRFALNIDRVTSYSSP